MAETNHVTVAVNGATGFIGVHVASELVNRGHRVVGIVRPNEAAENLDVLQSVGARAVAADFCDPDALVAALESDDFHVYAGGLARMMGMNYSSFAERIVEADL